MLKACILKMFLNFLMVMPEPWKGSVSEVYQIRTTDGSDERMLVPNGNSLPKIWIKFSLFEGKNDIFVLYFQKFCTL